MTKKRGGGGGGGPRQLQAVEMQEWMELGASSLEKQMSPWGQRGLGVVLCTKMNPNPYFLSEVGR